MLFLRNRWAHRDEWTASDASKLAPAPKPSNVEDEIQNAADALHAWLSDWTGQARAFITRGDYLIRLGLSSRKSRADDEDDEVFEDEDEDESSAPNATEVAS